jgi:hypothetical protein
MHPELMNAPRRHEEYHTLPNELQPENVAEAYRSLMATPINYPKCPKCGRALLYVDEETKTCPTNGHYTIRIERPTPWWKALVTGCFIWVREHL